MLASSGGDVNMVSASGDSPLHVAIRYAATRQSPIPDPTTVEKLLELGARVDIVSKNGNSPLHVACLYGASNLVTLLLNSKVRSPHRCHPAYDCK